MKVAVVDVVIGEPLESVVVKTMTEVEMGGEVTYEVLEVVIREPSEFVVVYTMTVGELEGGKGGYRPVDAEQTAVFTDTVTVTTELA